MIPVLLALAAVSALAQQMPDLRLPGDVRPVRYDLELNINPAQDDYSGRIGIDVEVKQPVSIIWINSTDLKLTRATVGSQAATVLYGAREFAGIKLPQSAPAGRTRIDIEFMGTLNKRDVEGLFKQSENGVPYVYTQFEPTSARRAFPCFDEPAYKVPWKITLQVPKDSKAVANTPQIAESTEGDYKIVRFAESKPMPSYLVAVAVGPFDIVDAGTAGRNKVPVRTIAMNGRGAETAFVNDVTPKIVAALEDYFGIPYPYEKLDQIAIPITFGFGAMENAGLITYNQTLLLARKDDDSISRQRRAASVITHELGHQWFGNMVTPMWWDDIWLNEAFATWITGVIIDKVFPEWKAKVTQVNNTAEVMAQDQLLAARRIRQPIVDHGDIGNAFDGITYQKGAAVIRMFEYYVGRERMQKGIQNYLHKHAWGNATAGDFLAAISGAAEQNITPAFSQYLDRSGLPLLTVELKCEGKPRLAVTQQRSLPAGSKGTRAEYWPTPVCIRYEVNGKVTRHCTLIADPKDEIPLGGCPEWINANDSGTGYYQVIYKGDLQSKLVARSASLGLHEKVAILRNAQALVRTGLMPVRDALSLAREFRNAPEREVVEAAVEVATSIRKNVPADARAKYEQFLRDAFGPRARELGWQGKSTDTPDTQLLRRAIVPDLAEVARDPHLIAEAKKLAQAWLKDRAAVEPDLVQGVLSVAAQNSGREFFDQLVAAAKQTRNRRERGYMIQAIGSFRDPEIARAALQIMLTGDLDIRELTRLLTDFHNDPSTEAVPWQFVKANYEALLPKLPSRLAVHGGAILPNAGAGFCSEAGYREVEGFFRERIKPITGGARSLAKTLEGIELCAPLRATQGPEISAFLKEAPR